jgi:tetratricopeptide (TPR) repeat protein
LTEATYYMHLDEAEKAIAAYHRVLDLNPGDTWALNNLGVMTSDLGRHREAMEYYVRANELEPSALVLGNIGVTHILLGEYDQAQQTAREFHELYPDNPFGTTIEVNVQIAQGELAVAESLAIQRLELEAARESPFLRARFLGALASITAVRGRLGEAERYSKESAASFERAGDISNQFFEASRTVWTEVFIRENPVKAKTELEALETQFPLERFEAVDRPYRELATLYALIGNPSVSRALLERETREVDPLILKSRLSVIHEVQGIIALAESRPRDAVKDFLAYRAENPGAPLNGLAGLAYAYDQGGELDSARVFYERFLTTPEVFRVRDDSFFRARSLVRLGEIYESRGERARALEYYSQFVELWKDADPELQARVRDVRGRIERLQRRRG